FHFCVQTHFVADVGEVRVLRPDRVDHFERLRKIEVGDVLFALQGIQYEYFGAPEFFNGVRWNGLGVGDITEIADPEAEDGEVQMHDRQGEKCDAVDVKRIAVNSCQA